MLPFCFPLFGETDFLPCKLNDRSHGCVIPHSDRDTFARYCQAMEERGFSREERRETPLHSFAAYRLKDQGIFINFYENLHELNLIVEDGCSYFDFQDTPLPAIVSPQIDQVDLDDFGLSYVIRLSDGRFIVIDGGWDFPPDADALLRALKEHTPHKKPIIAAWFLTHPDCDHFHCLVGFLDRFADQVILQKLLYNFPEAYDARYPKFTNTARRPGGYGSDRDYILRLETHIQKMNIPVCMPHTGQIYRIGDSVCEILSSYDDTADRCDATNAMSLVIRMELGGQIILWTADAQFDSAHLLSRYGDHLKADIMQIPHHGFSSASDKTQIETYKTISPKVCLLPVSDYNAFTAIDSFIESTKFLFTRLGIDEVIPGDPHRILSLPYTPPPYAKKELEKRYLSGLDQNGSKTWIFTDLNTNNKEDFIFSLLNTARQTEVFIELFFENESDYIGYIKTELPKCSIRKLCIIDTNDVNADYRYLNRDALDKKGIPENRAFAVRFIATEPIVVANQNHKATYYAPNR